MVQLLIALNSGHTLVKIQVQLNIQPPYLKSKFVLVLHVRIDILLQYQRNGDRPCKALYTRAWDDFFAFVAVVDWPSSVLTLAIGYSNKHLHPMRSGGSMSLNGSSEKTWQYWIWLGLPTLWVTWKAPWYLSNPYQSIGISHCGHCRPLQDCRTRLQATKKAKRTAEFIKSWSVLIKMTVSCHTKQENSSSWLHTEKMGSG